VRVAASTTSTRPASSGCPGSMPVTSCTNTRFRLVSSALQLDALGIGGPRRSAAPRRQRARSAGHRSPELGELAQPADERARAGRACAAAGGRPAPPCRAVRGCGIRSRIVGTVAALLLGGEVVLGDDQRDVSSSARSTAAATAGIGERIADARVSGMRAEVGGRGVAGVHGEELALDVRARGRRRSARPGCRGRRAERRALDRPLEERLDVTSSPRRRPARARSGRRRCSRRPPRARAPPLLGLDSAADLVAQQVRWR
jgi:hypothetical protein